MGIFAGQSAVCIATALRPTSSKQKLGPRDGSAALTYEIHGIQLHDKSVAIAYYVSGLG